MPLKLGMLDLLHLEDVGRFRVLQVFLDLLLVVELEQLKSLPELLLHLVG